MPLCDDYVRHICPKLLKPPYVCNGCPDRNTDMPRTVRMRKSKVLKVDKEGRKGRTYEDFLKFMEENPDSVVCEGDSVEGVKGGKVLLTLFIVQQNLQLAFLRNYNDSRSVTEIFERLYIELRPDDDPHQFIFKGEALKQELL